MSRDDSPLGSVTAAKRIDSRARLQFRFFLNLFNCLLITNLSRRNNRSPEVLEQIKLFLMFHINFTVRRILLEIGVIQRESAIPGDPTFSRIIIIVTRHRSNESWCRIWNFIKRGLPIQRG